MALIDTNNPIVSQSAENIRDDYLKNLLINLDVVQKAIFELTKVGVKSAILLLAAFGMIDNKE
ncbi:MAG: hypothetical protein LBK66_05060 [Spirochaetaceae bacterium]|jgi:hypothetical protein|nr:hypothetical protein [Spirochaetaceae bacterium]